MTRRTAVAAAALLAGAVTALAAPPASAQATGTVYVVHGIPDTPVDVYVDGTRALDDFAPGTSQGPLPLPAGSYDVDIFAADAPDGSGTPLLTAPATLGAGDNVTLVAHLTEGGDPTVTPFVNDVSNVAAGQARVVVRHTAAAPAVDVLAGGSPAVSGLSNPDQEAVEVPAGTVSAAVAAAGTSAPVIGPANLTLQEGTATFVHAIGSLEAGNLNLVTFTVSGLHSAPSAVPAGSSPSDDVPAWLTVGALAGLVLVAGSGARIAAARTRG